MHSTTVNKKVVKLKAALIILYDSEKRFLLQHRSAGTKVLPNHWAFFGGGIKKGETPENTVRREALEELNYKLRKPKLFAEQNFRLDNIEGYMYVYIDAFYGDKSGLKLNEGRGWGWYNLPDIGRLKMAGHDRKLIELLARYLETLPDGDKQV